MPLILAIEPDGRQAAHLTSVVRRRVEAELILVDTTERALDAIGNRVPDLVLVPALLSPQDDAALATALRVIAAAAHVQMLTIPVLGARRPAARSTGSLLVLRRDRSRSAEPEGCDPTVFAEQIASYLARAAEERANLVADALSGEAAPVEVSTQIAVTEDALPEIGAPSVAQIEADAASGFGADVETDVAAAAEATTELAAAVEAPTDADAIVDEATHDVESARAVDESVWLAIEEAVRTQFLNATPESAPPPTQAQLTSSEETTTVPEDAPSSDDADPSMLPLDEFIAVLEDMQLPTIEASEGGDWAPSVIGESADFDEDPDAIDADLTAEIDDAADAGEESGDWVAEPEVAELVTAAADEPAPLEPPPAGGVDESVWAAIEEAVRAQFSNKARVEIPIEATEDFDDAIDEPRDGELWMALGAWNAPPRLSLEGLPSKPALEVSTAVTQPEPAMRPESAAPAGKGEREWVELIASLRHDIERLRAEGSKPPAKPSAPRPVRIGKKARVTQDEWGFFDPEQCGFAALLAKLDEVTESEKGMFP